ncbi:alpha/beta hydrolase [Limosilactobacillus reuteri]|uniref:alpha/beta hydrolase n=1 Tax=Limosilactobacillus reuteri TaxID=1598 RepID=UPI002B055BA4|nr:alpha/beta hydrolase fold domain-containing protein [Limosilactobacillus reuteri]
MKHTLKVDQVRDGLWLDSDITYTQVPGWLGNTTRDLKLSVIRHFQTNDDTRYPVIFWFAGGGWMDTDPNVHLPNLVDFARHGYIVVGVEYRDSNKVQFPGQLEDAKAAIRYIRANAKRFQTEDVVVPIKDSEKLYDALVENNVPAELYEVEGASHMDVRFLQPQVFKIVMDFLDKYLTRP